MKRLSFQEFRVQASAHGFVIAPFYDPPDLWSVAMEIGRREEREQCIKDCEGVDLIGAEYCVEAIKTRRPA